jgi:hypothetical protein
MPEKQRATERNVVLTGNVLWPSGLASAAIRDLDGRRQPRLLVSTAYRHDSDATMLKVDGRCWYRTANGKSR